MAISSEYQFLILRMDQYQTDRFQLSEPDISNDEALFEMVNQSIADPNAYTSNFETIFSSTTCSSLEAFTEFRRKTCRMNAEVCVNAFNHFDEFVL